MTHDQATAEAKSRWGCRARAVHYPRHGSTSFVCIVGRTERGTFFCVRGHGATWEDAFADADKDEAVRR